MLGFCLPADAEPWMHAHSLLVRPESLTAAFMGGDWSANVAAFAADARDAGVHAVFLEMRAVDPDDTSQTGHLYFRPTPDPDFIQPTQTIEPFVSSLGEEFEADGNRMLHELIGACHRQGLEVCAWLPVLSDQLLYSLGPPYIMEPDRWEPGFVTPYHSAVLAHELALVRSVVDEFCIEGVNLDYLRYQADEQPQDAAADAQWQLIHAGVPIATVAETGGSHPLWVDYLDFRAATLTALAAGTKAIVGSDRAVEFGAFLMPHSAKTTNSEGWPYGYYMESWSGVNYEELASVGMNLMPMVYWEYPDWTSPYSAQEFTSRVARHSLEWASEKPPSDAIPLFSYHRPTWELIQHFQLARAEGHDDISLFYWSDWPGELQKLVDVLEGVNGEGPAGDPVVTITLPEADPRPRYMPSQSLRFTAAVTGGGAVADAWYRIDGGTWLPTEAGPFLEQSGIGLHGLSTGCHTLTVRVVDDAGRPGQDLRVFGVYEPQIREAPKWQRRN